jgi:hypothetical protein
MRRKLLVACVLSLTCVAQSMAADVKVGGIMYPQYQMTGSKKNLAGDDAKGYSAFEVTRLYVTGDVKVDDHWKGRFILETQTNGTDDAGEGQNAVFLKQAFIEYANLMDKGVNIQFGQIPTLWQGYEDAIWGHRYVAKTSLDHWSALATADKGVSIWIPLPMSFGNFQAAYVNGTGAKNTENTTTPSASTAGRQKDIHLRLAITPLPNMDVLKGLQLHGYMLRGRWGYTQVADAPATPQNRNRSLVLGGVSFKHELGHVMGYYWEGQNTASTNTNPVATGAVNKSKGYSVHADVNVAKAVPSVSMLEGIGLFWAYYRMDTGARTAEIGQVDGVFDQGLYQPKTFWVAGVSKTFNPNVRFAANIQNAQQYQTATLGAVRATENNRHIVYSLNGELKF